MKKLIVRGSLALLVLVVVMMSGCQGDEPTAQEKTEAILISAEWNNPSVTVDGVDQSALYQTFIIKFTKGTYTSSGGGPLWPSSGTWVFTDETGKMIILDGKMEVHINEITENSLELAVQNVDTTFASGRTNSIKGKNVFKLKKK